MFLVVIPLLFRVVCSFLFSNIASTFPLYFDITQPRIIVSLKDILLLYIFASLHFIYAKRKCYVEFSSLVVSHTCAPTPHMLLKIFTYNVSPYNPLNVFALSVCVRNMFEIVELESLFGVSCYLDRCFQRVTLYHWAACTPKNRAYFRN